MTFKSTSRKLNLGSGEFLKEGFINVDYYSNSTPDISHNLNQLPYPFENDYFERVEADHVFEHLYEPFQVMQELHRICAPKPSSTSGFRIFHEDSLMPTTNAALM